MSTTKRTAETTAVAGEEYGDVKKQKLENLDSNTTANSKDIPVNDINNAIENAKKHSEENAAESQKEEQNVNNDEDNAIDPVLNEHQGSGQNEQRKLFNNEQQEAEAEADAEVTKSKEVLEQKEPEETSLSELSKSSTDPSVLLKLKKMNHKEVERRRRETINNAIRELQDLVPTTHTNKAQIIRKASEYIKKLKEKEENLVNKWTLEKIITDQAISELANSNEKLKSELEKAYRENERFKHIIKSFIGEVKGQSNNSDSVKDIIKQTEELFQEVEEEDSGEENVNLEQTPDENIDAKLKNSEQEPEVGSEAPES